jgi:hypothetical protein
MFVALLALVTAAPADAREGADPPADTAAGIPAPAGSPDAARLAALTGTWRLAEPRPTVQARVEAAVDTALAPFNLVIRGLARPRLLTIATFCDTYRTTLTPTSFTVACDDRGAATGLFDQPPTTGTSGDGHAYQLAATFADGTAVLTFRGEEGYQRVRYRAGDTGGFAVEKTVHSDRLARDVTWAMAYARQ